MVYLSESTINPNSEDNISLNSVNCNRYKCLKTGVTVFHWNTVHRSQKYPKFNSWQFLSRRPKMALRQFVPWQLAHWQLIPDNWPPWQFIPYVLIKKTLPHVIWSIFLNSRKLHCLLSGHGLDGDRWGLFFSLIGDQLSGDQLSVGQLTKCLDH